VDLIRLLKRNARIVFAMHQQYRTLRPADGLAGGDVVESGLDAVFDKAQYQPDDRSGNMLGAQMPLHQLLGVGECGDADCRRESGASRCR